MAHLSRTVEEGIARIATARKGVLTREELLRAGITVHQITARVRSGYLIRVHRGVYRVGHAAPSTEATYLAAVKACGERAYLVDRAAGHHQELLPRTRNPPPPAVMCPTQRSVEGVKTRRSRNIHPQDVCVHEGIPITTVPRTLLDLAATVSDEELVRACHEAWIKWRTGAAEVRSVLERRPNARGAGRLRRILTGATPITLSRLETRFLALLRRERIELPETNRRVGSGYVDCRWPGRLTVELDSFRFHNSRQSWEQGHQRQREARARREEFRRYTWWDVTEGRHETASEVRALLASG